MCRIAGILDKNASSEKLTHFVSGMCHILRKGGPDDEGIYSSPEHNLVLGNRRLALIDLSNAGHQPMSYCGRYHITYNGELYNFQELKDQLIEKKFAFNTNSDTEVILASFAAWNTKAFAKFNGMFAFALLDKEESKMYLVRDASGIKPLYYSANSSKVVFASEIKAFKILGDFEENGNWPIYMMAYGHLPEPITTLQLVKPLPKGTYLEYHIPGGKWDIEKFYQYTYSEKIQNRDEAIELVKQSLSTAVKRHLIADAPVGVFLSGGIDSSIIALLANKYHSKLNTLSLYFSESEYSEKKYQDIIQQNLDCTHFQHLLTAPELNNYLPEILDDMDLPSVDGLNTWFISKYAKAAGLKAVLSGVGGDELFGGYPSFNRMNLANSFEKLPDVFLKASSQIGLKKLKRLCYLSLGGAKGKYLFLRGNFIPVEIAKHLDMEEEQVWKILKDEPELNDITSLTLKNQASWIEFNLYMQNQLLRDADVMGMAHGVEIRVPFLDQDFINLLLQIQSNIKYSGLFKKQLLIDAFKNLLPEPVWNRPKMGFSFPFKEWLAKNEFVKSSLHSYTNSAKESYKKFTEGNMHWSQIMTLMLLQKNAKA